MSGTNLLEQRFKINHIENKAKLIVSAMAAIEVNLPARANESSSLCRVAGISLPWFEVCSDQFMATVS